MRRRKHSARTLLFAIVLLVSLVAPSGTASAASDYDNVIESVNSVHLSRDGVTQGSPACASRDLTSSWASVLTNSSSWTSRTQIIGGATQSATLADWATTLENEVGWAVVQQHQNNASTPYDGSPLGDAVYVVFTPLASAQVSFSSDAIYYGAQKQAYMTNADDGYVYSVRIQFDDLGSSGGSDQCTPVISMAWRKSPSSSWFKETASVATTSTESSGGYSLRPLFINAPVTYPSGYEGEIVSAVQPPATHVFVGDSFSSGEGNAPFEYGTDEDDVNECHRSSQAYPRLLQAELEPRPTAFVACSGATTNDVLGITEDDNPHGKWNESAQIDALSADTEVVTITIGGNDIGFSEFAKKCVSPLNTLALDEVCDEFTDIYEDTVWKINNELPDKLENVYGALLNEAENADIYVLGYPNIAPFKDVSDPFDQDCGGLYDEFPNNWGDARAAHEITGLLNDAIEDAVDAANTQYSSSRLVFVSVENGAFAGHDACSSDSYFNGIVFPDTEHSIHPNASGHVAYKEDLSDAMS